MKLKHSDCICVAMLFKTKEIMRKIKFRCWDKDFNEYSSYHLSRTTVNDIKECERFVFEQFTGLKDRTGIEIYEGDVVTYYQPYSKKTETHIVKWDDMWAGFGLFEKDNKWCKESDWVKIQEIEIIGNIHQNKE